MIRRIVKLTFKAEHIDDFKSIFEESKDKIVQSDGCHAVDLLQHASLPHIFFTFSIWESEEDLNNYRHSEFFQQTWKNTKALFDDRPEAWSTELLGRARKIKGSPPIIQD